MALIEIDALPIKKKWVDLSMAIAVSHTSPDATPFCWLHGPGPCHGQVDVGLHRVLRPGRCAAHHGHRGVARRMR